ncbi:ATP-dependent DNA ligase [Actinoalloteichus sp. AHMU CJ021]|uniref:DNA ligase (ATP) n=1 Tax=Actinoalloteichus caeruleus DSM 43889 TaxID=1120930 RepID=A0ABT1JGT8_ACTCY|nr:ATP-dependent DNA ligase [Actinoalloteichus caeruleus]AUS77773.1 ATP-dependent DNA ligase [Actinoalloteichus sp. AHMU CJ021]MCP2331719.1 ATP-dependent DNA ligase [Actinoalloteichus caeruleus DSM 43889]
MALPLAPPVAPMLARPVADLPAGDYLFEPKWDGFRCLVFRDGEDVVLQSRTGKSLDRYFPEVVREVRDRLPAGAVVDGELVVAVGDRLDFDAMSERIHPAESRVRALAERTPATFVAFDLLADANGLLVDEPFEARRAALERMVPASTGGVRLTPVTRDRGTARRWFELFEGAGLDGVIAKAATDRYQPGQRVMLKVKHQRTADCVVGGLRWHKGTEPGTAVGSLLLGLYDEHAVLHHVGVCATFTAARRRALATELMPLAVEPSDHPWSSEAGEGRRVPGQISRWRSTEQPWQPLRPERVVEVGYDHLEGAHPARFRHTTSFLRWRPDRDPVTCGYDQLDEPVRFDLASVLRGEVRGSP